jgi:RNA-binding protein Nova
MDMGFTGGGFGYPGAASNALPSVTNSYGAANVPALETLKMTLRNSGFSVQASDEITAAMCTLANYGLLGTGLALGGFGFANGPGQCGLTLDYLSGILSGRPMGPQKPTDKFPCGSGGSQYPNVANGQEMFSSSYGSYGNMMNQNSFGLGSAAQQQTGAEGDTTGGGTTTKDIQIGENIVGAVLGHGGRAIVEIQRMTSATIQISKKGVFAPGTRNRIATISGAPAAVERAVYLVQQCIQQEEMKRSRQEQMLK